MTSEDFKYSEFYDIYSIFYYIYSFLVVILTSGDNVSYWVKWGTGFVLLLVNCYQTKVSQRFITKRKLSSSDSDLLCWQDFCRLHISSSFIEPSRRRVNSSVVIESVQQIPTSDIFVAQVPDSNH